MSATPRIRLNPDDRREQLLELGVKLFATRRLEDFSIDVLAEAAGISRGLLYYYFGNKRDFQEAVVRRSVEDLIELTAPVDHPDLVQRLFISVDRYVAYVEDNLTAYQSIVRAAHSGNETMRRIYQDARFALADRIFESATPEDLAAHGLTDTPGSRLFVRGWTTMVEDTVLAWADDPRGITRAALIDSLCLALAAIGSVAPAAGPAGDES